MTHYGIVSVSFTGPLNTMLPLGQELQRRGHQVTLIALLDTQLKAQAAGIPFRAIGQEAFPVGSLKASQSHLGKLSGLAALRYTIEILNRSAEVLLQDAPEICREIGVEAPLVNQGTSAGGTLADHLRIPFITVCSAAVLNRESTIPPCITQWQYSSAWSAQLRNRFGYWLLERMAQPIINTISQYRQQWQLLPYNSPDDGYSDLAQISQAPAAFEFPRQYLPSWFHFTGPFHTSDSREKIPFPWEQINPDKPVIYASMGTLQNQLLWVFEKIAEACSSLEAQFSHAGMNTTMECLMHGVPMIAIPVTNDQPGVSSRIVWPGVGERISLRKLNVEKLRAVTQSVLTHPSYKEAALRLQSACRSAGGAQRAADIIETVVATGQPILD